MLIAFEMLPRSGAQWTGEVVVVGRNPEIIDQADPEELPGYGMAVALRLQGSEVMFVKGTVEEVILATHGLQPCQEQENTDTA